MNSFLIIGMATMLMLTLVVAITTTTTAAFAQGKLPESGFGKASKDFATSEPGALGEHSSSFAGESRQGIGNVAGGGQSVGELGCTLDAAAGFGGC
jgi:hypothetical protein